MSEQDRVAELEKILNDIIARCSVLMMRDTSGIAHEMYWKAREAFAVNRRPDQVTGNRNG